jgi:hypothetical protein
MRIEILFLVLLFAVLITGCGQWPVYKISSVEENIGYYNGNEVVGKIDSAAKVFIEFIHQTEPCFVFYIQIENLSEDILLVEPSKSLIKNYYSKSRLDDNSLNSISFALNPQTEINRINSKIGARETIHGVSTACNCLGGIFSVVSEATSDEEGHDDIGVWIDRQMEEEIDYDSDMQNLKSEKDFWQNEVLLNSVLQPGEVTGGQIFFKKDNNAEYFNILIVFDKTKFEFLYRQIRAN